MGRPRDQFAWAQVQVSEDGTWKCKYCSEEFKGAASRIRNHLSGKGNDISSCAAAPEVIRNHALNTITRKRGREKSSVQDPSCSTSNSLMSFTEKAKEVHVTDAFMKCLLTFSSSSISVISDFTKDPCLREFLKRAAEHGVPSSLLVDDSEVVRNSVFNIKEEVYRHMLMLKESWKTTGCTLMVFNEKSSSTLEEDMVLVGFYCPKEIIFAEAPDPAINYVGFKRALTQHSPSLDFHFQITYLILRHGSGDTIYDLVNNVPYAESNRCLRDEIEEICIDSCRESV